MNLKVLRSVQLYGKRDIHTSVYCVGKDKKAIQFVLIFLHCPGYSSDKLLIKSSVDDVMRHLNVNLTSTMLASKFILRNMLVSRKGSIINIGKSKMFLIFYTLCKCRHVYRL